MKALEKFNNLSDTDRSKIIEQVLDFATTQIKKEASEAIDIEVEIADGYDHSDCIYFSVTYYRNHDCFLSDIVDKMIVTRDSNGELEVHFY